MNQKIIAAVFFIGVFTLTGCESKQAKATRLGKVANDLEQQYRKDCFDPFKGDSSNAVSNAMLGTDPSAQDKAAAAQHQRDEQARIASPYCQELKAKKTAAGLAWASALNTGSSQ